MKKIIILSITAIVVIAIASVGTFAYFSDTETSSNNTFTAGTLNLQVGSADPTTATFAITDVKPGDGVPTPATAADWDLKNTGSINGYLDVSFTNIVDDENGLIEPESSDGDTTTPDGELAEDIVVLIYVDEDGDNAYTNETNDYLIFNDHVKGGTTALSAATVDDFPMAAGYAKSIRVEYSVATSIGNEIQSDKTGFDMVLSLEQNAD
jgi:spore coat-associated protein N